MLGGPETFQVQQSGYGRNCMSNVLLNDTQSSSNRCVYYEVVQKYIFCSMYEFLVHRHDGKPKECSSVAPISILTRPCHVEHIHEVYTFSI